MVSEGNRVGCHLTNSLNDVRVRKRSQQYLAPIKNPRTLCIKSNHTGFCPECVSVYLVASVCLFFFSSPIPSAFTTQEQWKAWES